MKINFYLGMPAAVGARNYISQSVNTNKKPNKYTLSNGNLVTGNCTNISFMAKPDSSFLVAQSDKLLCAYSRKVMISPYDARTIYNKLKKKPNAQSACNFLKIYRNYMHDIESYVFDTFCEYPNKGKKTFQDILIEERPESLARLEERQAEVLNETNDKIAEMDKTTADMLFQIRDTALAKTKDGTFSRQEVLNHVISIKTGYDKKNTIDDIYKTWYKLPRSSKDYDAFVVKYSRYSHDAIAERLISSAVATIEHIKPSARGGVDNMENYLLVSAHYNNDRDSIPLAEYIELNPDIDIKHNIQRFLDDISEYIKNGRSPFGNISWYPQAVKKTIAEETEGAFIPAVDDKPKQNKTNSLTASHKGANRYITNRNR